MEWTFEDQEQALRQGWGVFLVDGNPDKPEVQKYDEYPGPHSFASDFDALDWVMNTSGDLAEKARQICGIKKQERKQWNKIVRVEICFWRTMSVRFYSSIDLENSFSQGTYKRNYPTQQQIDFLMAVLKGMNFIATIDVENYIVIYQHPSYLRKEQK